MERITVIKATKRNDMWDYNNNKPIEDTTPIGYVMDVNGQVPESYIKWTPNKIFDRRKYPELYNIFGKDHLPNELELRCYVIKHWNEWHKEDKNEISFLETIKYIFYCLLLLLSMLMLLTKI